MSGPDTQASGTEPDATQATARRPAAPQLIPEQGARVGRFIVVEEIGRGAMGVVLLAYDPKLHREVALKLLRLAGHDAHLRLVREAQAMAKLNHPNVVAVYDVDVSGEHVFVAMEYVPGTTLRGWMQTPRRPWMQTVGMFVPAGRGLAEAHARGLVHRDFKPANVLVGEDGRPRVTDFGLVRGDLEPPSTELTGTHDDSPLSTAEGAIMGTPAYMAPEQWGGGDEVGPASDQYAFCVALWEALHGQRPFAGKNRAHLHTLKAAHTVASPRERSVPRRINQALVRGMAPRPRDRWPDMRALLDHLSTRPRGWAPVAGVALAIAATGATTLALSGEASPCQQGRDKLAEIWSPSRRAAVERALLAKPSTLATQTWTRVEARVTGWGQTWAEGYDQACRATRVEQVQSSEVLDRRVACLMRARSEAKVAIDLLAEAHDDAVMRRAVDLVSALPAPDRCADVERLLATVARPEDPATAAAVDQLHQQVDEVQARLHAGQPAHARTLLDALDPQVAAVDYPPLHAELDVVATRVLEIEGRFADAEQRIRRAFVVALEAGDDANAAIAAGSLLTLVGTQQGRPAEGEQWAPVATTLARRSRDPGVEGIVLSGLGTLAVGQGRYERALEAFEAQLAHFTRAYGAGSPRTAQAHGNVAGALSYLGRAPEALSHMEQTLEIQREALGSAHPRVGLSLAHLGLLEHDLGRKDDALDHMERGIAIANGGRSTPDPAVEGLRVNFAGALMADGRLDEAGREYEAAEAALGRFHGEDHPHVALVIRARAELALRRDRPRDAIALLDRALAIYEARQGADHPETIDTMTRLGRAWLVRGDRTRALQVLDEAHRRAPTSTLTEPQRAELDRQRALAMGQEIDQDAK